MAGDGTIAHLATQWTVQARNGATCVVRVVMSGFGRGQSWDDEIDGLRSGMRRSLGLLTSYLARTTDGATTDRTAVAACSLGAVIPVSDLAASL